MVLSLQVSIMSFKWDIEKFSIEVKMQARLIQQRCVEAMKGGELMPSSLTHNEKTVMMDKAESFVILYITN